MADQEIAPVNGTASTEASLLQSYGKEYSQQLLGLDVLALSAGRSHEAKRWLFHYVSPLMHLEWRVDAPKFHLNFVFLRFLFFVFPSFSFYGPFEF